MIIGLTGDAGSGKDTAAAVLVNEFGFERMAFADSMRAGLLTINPTVHAEGEFIPLDLAVKSFGWDVAKREFGGRRLLETFGDAVKDIAGHDVFVNHLDKMIGMTCMGSNVVVTDVRFLNEVDMIRHYGGVIVKVDRVGNTEAKSTHHSATQTLIPDHTLFNDGTLAEFAFEVRELHAFLAERVAA